MGGEIYIVENNKEKKDAYYEHVMQKIQWS